MGKLLRTIWNFTVSLEGLMVILIFLVAVVSKFYFGFNDIAFFVSIAGFLITIILVIKDKVQKIGLVEHKIVELTAYLDKIKNNEIINYNSLDSTKIKKWDKEITNYFRKELSKNISTNYDVLIDFALEKWVSLFDLTTNSQKDFLRYIFYREIYDSDIFMLKIVRKYASLSNEEFLSYIYRYFISDQKDIKNILETPINLSQEQKQKALFFLKGIIEEFETIISRLNDLKGSENKSKFLEKLNEEMREYLHSKGISLDKYAEAFLSKNKHAFLLFQQKLGGELKNKLIDKKVKNLPLYFTGPYLIISDEIKSAYDLKKCLQIDPKSSESHNLLIVRILPSDVHISTGIDRKSKKSSKKQIKRIREILTKVGELSDSTKKYALIMDKPLQEFVESLTFDFLIIDKIGDKVKITLRESTNRLKDELKKENYTISNITDLYNVPIETLKTSLSKIGINKDVDKVAESLIKGANSWRYILYGYGKNESDSKE